MAASRNDLPRHARAELVRSKIRAAIAPKNNNLNNKIRGWAMRTIAVRTSKSHYKFININRGMNQVFNFTVAVFAIVGFIEFVF
jgi:hypothetical protein